MKFSVLSLDYDGTIARAGKLDPDVRASIEEARARGIVVVLVTGRILSDLRQGAGGLDIFDAINAIACHIQCPFVRSIQTVLGLFRRQNVGKMVVKLV
jgi:hydroxymethylpyrimidine pyrophosphatase-like HAD family hydrolase